MRLTNVLEANREKIHSHKAGIKRIAMRFFSFYIALPVCACYIVAAAIAAATASSPVFFSFPLLISNNLKEGKIFFYICTRCGEYTSHSERLILLLFCYAFVNLTRWQCNQRMGPCTSRTLDRQILRFSHKFLILMYGI